MVNTINIIIKSVVIVVNVIPSVSVNDKCNISNGSNIPSNLTL